MNVKFYFLTLLVASLAVSCVDDGYDLSNINTDDIAIGSESSEFNIPIATITFTDDDFDTDTTIVGSVTRADDSSDMTFSEIMDKLDAFLPNGTEADVSALTSDNEETSDAEIDRLTEALTDELEADDNKNLEFAELLYDYQDEIGTGSAMDDVFVTIGITSSEGLTVEAIQTAQNTALADETTKEALKSSISTAVKENVVEDLKEYAEMKIDESIDVVEIPSDILSFFEDDENGKLYLIATYEHNFPFSFTLDPLTLSNSASGATPIQINLTAVGSDLEPKEINLDDFTSLLESGDGATTTTQINLNSFQTNDDDDYKMTIYLSFRKTGAIKL